MVVLNYGSLNIDRVFEVDHIVRPGETLGTQSLRTFAGGKGQNQSIALARAGARVSHAGQVGSDGVGLVQNLGREGVDTRFVQVGDAPTGQAIIQVDARGQNAILLLAGANHRIDPAQAQRTLEAFPAGTVLLLQNEINGVGELLAAGKRRGMTVCLNPAPFTSDVPRYPLDQVDLLIANETEAEGLTGQADPDRSLAALAQRHPPMEVILTLGAQGAVYQGGGRRIRAAGLTVRAVDTTAAGDTFIGYYLACRGRGMAVEHSLQTACKAAALCVTRPGAADSIPRWEEVQRWNP